jgi:tRNA-(ms[2]io[6]A)-hydroxylase
MENSTKVMLGLRLPTDPRWVNIAEKNISDVLSDHAWCEQKAALNAMSTIVRFPQHQELVTELTRIALEEMEHFEMVHEKIKARGFQLGHEQRDCYVQDLSLFIKKGGDKSQELTERLLFAAMIEARSCERFRILSEEIGDDDLKAFYRELMISEATHYTSFIGLAKKYGDPKKVDRRWQEFLDFESTLMEKYGRDSAMHG